jgi:hypothetical protein
MANNGTATNTPFGIKFIKRQDESIAPVDYRVVSAGVTVVANTLGIINTSTGNLDNHTPGAAEKIFCVINQGGTAGDRVQVTPIYPGDMLTAQSTSTVAVAQSDIGDTCEITGTGSSQGLNVGTASNPVAVILELSEDPIDNTIGKWCNLNFTILNASLKTGA